MVIEVVDIKVFRHNPKPCRYCGHVFERSCGESCESTGGFTMRLINPHGSGLSNCPNCGIPTSTPMNELNE